MDTYYFDSSAVVKLYISEQGSSWIEQIAQPGKPDEEAERLAGFTLIGIAETGEELTFVTADDVLHRAAQAAGLIVENPNYYP